VIDLSPRSRSIPLYRRIADEFRRSILAGTTEPGARLPPQRELAEARGVTLGTVFRAYAELRREGLIDATVGKGSFVTGPARPVAEQEIDLRANLPPVRRVSADLLRVLSTSPDLLDKALFGEQSILATNLQHYCTATDWLTRYHGISAPRQTLISSGGQAALSCILMALCKPGDVVLTENLTFIGLRLVAEAFGLQLIGLEMDEHGLSPESLEAMCVARKPRLLFTTPNFHSPTTILMPESRRRQIADLARRYGVIVVEDDVYGPYVDQDLPRIGSLLPDSTVLFTSLAKLVAPGLRVGFLSVPDAFVGSISQAMRLMGAAADPVTWHVLAGWIKDGTLADFVEANRIEFKARHALASEKLSSFHPTGHPTCPHLWLELPPNLPRAADVVLRAALAGVQVLSADNFAVSGERGENAIRISLSAAKSRDELIRALDLLTRELSVQNREFAIA
jgi:DNA-binding transcriptional MocR family regulator